ncbi:MAG TPA: GNAT family N-acetyltransferase [Actinomycetes bacterium]|nr:GNAT family N-acetyltransferase [Actinomycetes bacterium]
MTPSDGARIQAAAHLFDAPPVPELTTDFLGRPGHHLLIAEVEGRPVGFITGIEIAHPDKRVEMLLYEMGVDHTCRRRGIGRALVAALQAYAQRVGCAGMWVPVEAGDDAALAFYRATGAHEPEPGATLWWPLP